MSIVRDNLMNREGYRPYCGNVNCSAGMPRTHYIKGQFQCGCDWRSSFEPEFIAAYEAKWASPAPETNVLGRREADAVVIPGTFYDNSLPIHHQRSRSLSSLDDLGGSPEATSFDDAANITHSRLDDFNPSMLDAIDNNSDFTPHSVLHPQRFDSIVEQKRNVEAPPHTEAQSAITPQMIRDTAAWCQSEDELRETLRQAALALEAASSPQPRES
ncbi:hypothetical protein ASG25_15595 [Rhizobium sp. Leaf384]|uniref:hypothetical protein n=1 Tax=unclassified Rhizobium TaxID=2613769 RepID=UPI00071573BB|nr:MULTISPECIES: hypothetical protein [unclassified Rhizobium]KQS76842.1 hypothetical protein ASG25_15595 [Rhizobium sp. Leaf384]KQS78113.1 hypothetical protein ASG58_06810 [Rhizobium sp. Leaf383]